MRIFVLAILLLAPLSARGDVVPPFFQPSLTERSCDGATLQCCYGHADFNACEQQALAQGYEYFRRQGGCPIYCRTQDLHEHLGSGVYELAGALGLGVGAVVLLRRRRQRATASTIKASPTNGNA